MNSPVGELHMVAASLQAVHGKNSVSLTPSSKRFLTQGDTNIIAVPPPQASRPPRRQAANRGTYNLSAVWTKLDDFLTGSENDSGGEDDTKDNIDSTWTQIKNLRKRLAEEESEEDSDSDEYKEEEQEHKSQWSWKRQRDSEDDGWRETKKRKRVGVSERGSSLRLSRAERQRLVDFVSLNINWEEAVRFIESGVGFSSQQANRRMYRSMAGGPCQNSNTNAATRLRTHWSEVVSKKIVGICKK